MSHFTLIFINEFYELLWRETEPYIKGIFGISKVFNYEFKIYPFSSFPGLLEKVRDRSETRRFE